MTRRQRAFRAWAARLVTLIALALCVSCTPPLLGTSDVELVYEAPVDPTPARFGEDLRALLLRRLGAARIGADVVQEGRILRVVVDESAAFDVDELVTWPGTLGVHELAEGVALGSPGRGLTMQTEARDSPYFVGSEADLREALPAMTVPAGHRVVFEPLFTRDAWRTRVVKTAPLGELADDVYLSTAEGGGLRLRATRGSRAEATFKTAAKLAEGPGVVIVRGHVSLGRPIVEDDVARLLFGSGLPSYARAQEEKQLLTTPRLPPLRRVGSVGLAPNVPIAAACVVLPVLLSLGWLAFVRRFDRAHPEPVWLVMVTFLLGGVATLPASLLEAVLARASPWLDPRLVTFGGRPLALPLAFVVFTLVVGLVEEGAKLLAATFAARRREFDEPVDGIVYGIVASLGFAAAENVRYFAVTRMAAPVVIARCFMSVPAHMFFGALWGYALGARLVTPRARLPLFLLLAASAHGMFDALLATEGAAMLAVVLNVGLASAFVVLVRRALRHGVVVPAMLAIRPEDRLLFRVGRPTAFAVAAVLVHVLAFGVFMLGAWYQLERHRPNTIFVAGSSILVALLAIAALGVSATLPLDVAVDAHGVTFAGATRAWNRIRSFRRRGNHVEVDCEAGPLLLGPATPEVCTEMEAALTARLGGPDGRGRSTTLRS